MKNNGLIKLCLFCNKKFASYLVLEEHLNQHILERPYKCSMCDADFPNRSNLYLHEKWKCTGSDCRKQIATKFNEHAKRIMKIRKANNVKKRPSGNECTRFQTKSEPLLLGRNKSLIIPLRRVAIEKYKTIKHTSVTVDQKSKSENLNETSTSGDDTTRATNGSSFNIANNSDDNSIPDDASNTDNLPSATSIENQISEANNLSTTASCSYSTDNSNRNSNDDEINSVTTTNNLEATPIITEDPVTITQQDAVQVRPSLFPSQQIVNLVKSLERVTLMKRKPSISNSEHENCTENLSPEPSQIEDNERATCTNDDKQNEQEPITSVNPTSTDSDQCENNEAANNELKFPSAEDSQNEDGPAETETNHDGDKISRNCSTEVASPPASSKIGQESSSVSHSPYPQYCFLPFDDERARKAALFHSSFSSYAGGCTYELPPHPTNLFFQVNGHVVMPVFNLHYLRQLANVTSETQSCNNDFNNKDDSEKDEERKHKKVQGSITRKQQKRKVEQNHNVLPKKTRVSQEKRKNQLIKRSWPHVCRLCKRRFQYPSGLKLHVTEVHSTIKPFTCNICNKKFSRKYNLYAHTANIHERDGPTNKREEDKKESKESDEMGRRKSRRNIVIKKPISL